MTILEFIASKIESGEIKTYSLVKVLSQAFNISNTEAKRHIKNKAVEAKGSGI